ncbi:Telomerase reverse transcriptase [Talaromyces islandicus]|uniref:Telomerase reverse transcriptase n=1 Tax=Talaromyces islandicus TaxID=28573 RepID=A0A0U1M7F3_TALIS|nr:Telomerase reverse transcriptase [Talaromyces islandicus]
MLLDLPTELIQIILGYTSPSAYIQAATCCKSLYTIASDSRDLVLAHLQRTPGVKHGVACRSTLELFTLLQRRVAALLLNANFYADRTTCAFNGKKHDVEASSIGRIGEFAVLALVFKEDPRVHLVYVNSNGAISLERSLDCSPPTPEECPGTIVKTTFASENSLAVLVRGQMIKEKKDLGHVFVEQMRQYSDDTFYYYFFHIPLTKDSPRSVCRLYERADFQPQAFACTNKSQIKFAISWQYLFHDWQHEVIFYCAWDDDAEVVDKQDGLRYLRYSEKIVVDENGHRPATNQNRASWAKFERKPLWRFGPVKGIKLNDAQAFYSYKGSTLFDYSQNFSVHDSGISRPLENLSEVQSFDMPFAVSPPFFRRHEIQGRDCDHQYLSFGTATHPSGHWSVACLLKNRDEFQYTTCGIPFEPEWDRLFEDTWVPVARLWGYQKPSMSTIDCSPVTSPQGTRIAVSNWDVVYVWALNPTELTEKGFRSNTYYPRSWWSSSSADGMVELRPAVFRLDAVCFKIIFTENEDIIMALTDKGLVILDLRPQGKGRRLTLEMQVP